jgi:hypothetical protein
LPFPKIPIFADFDAIWSYGKMATWPFLDDFCPYINMDIRHQMASIWVSPETAIKMQQSGEGIELIWAPFKK